jgi:hypothetical protein
MTMLPPVAARQPSLNRNASTRPTSALSSLSALMVLPPVTVTSERSRLTVSVGADETVAGVWATFARALDVDATDRRERAARTGEDVVGCAADSACAAIP